MNLPQKNHLFSPAFAVLLTVSGVMLTNSPAQAGICVLDTNGAGLSTTYDATAELSTTGINLRFADF